MSCQITDWIVDYGRVYFEESVDLSQLENFVHFNHDRNLVNQTQILMILHSTLYYNSFHLTSIQIKEIMYDKQKQN